MITIVCYALCCMEPIDDEESFEGEEDESHSEEFNKPPPKYNAVGTARLRKRGIKCCTLS